MNLPKDELSEAAGVVNTRDSDLRKLDPEENTRLVFPRSLSAPGKKSLEYLETRAGSGGVFPAGAFNSDKQNGKAAAGEFLLNNIGPY